MCVFVHKCASAYTRFFIGVRLHACLMIYMFACMPVRASVHVRACVRVLACMSTFCVSAFVYDFVFVHVYTRYCACATPVYSLYLTSYLLLLISYFLFLTSNFLFLTSYFYFLTSYFLLPCLYVDIDAFSLCMCTLAQTPYRRPSVCLCTCKSVHMHTSPRLYVVFMYVCNHVCMCVCGCVRACVRASVRMYVCFRTQMCKCIHAIFIFMGMHVCMRLHVCLLICMLHVCTFVHLCSCVKLTCLGVHVLILCECVCI